MFLGVIGGAGTRPGAGGGGVPGGGQYFPAAKAAKYGKKIQSLIINNHQHLVWIKLVLQLSQCKISPLIQFLFLFFLPQCQLIILCNFNEEFQEVLEQNWEQEVGSTLRRQKLLNMV